MAKRTVIVCDNCGDDIDPGRVYIVSAHVAGAQYTGWKVVGEVCGNCTNNGVIIAKLPAAKRRQRTVPTE